MFQICHCICQHRQHIWNTKQRETTCILLLYLEQCGAFRGTRPRPPLSGAGAAIRCRWEQRWPLRALLQPHPAGKPPGTHDGEAAQSSFAVSSLVWLDQCPIRQIPNGQRFKTVFVNRSDMHRWMAAFPNPTNPDREEDEVIYEDWGEDYSDATACVCVCFMSVVSYLCVYACQTVLRCSVWSSTLPSRQTSSPWSPLRSSTSSAKPTRVRTWRESERTCLSQARKDHYIQDCKHFFYVKQLCSWNLSVIIASNDHSSFYLHLASSVSDRI